MLKRLSCSLAIVTVFLLGYSFSKLHYKFEIKRINNNLDDCGSILMNYNKHLVDCNTALTYCGLQVQQLIRYEKH